MSPPIDDAHRPSRQRSNTTFAPFTWRRGKTEQAVPQQAEAVPPLSLEALIEALSPPAVPSINHARALASSLSSQPSSPRLAILSPILTNLCAAEQPASLQAAGYDILTAYWDNSGPAILTTADRLACLSLFLDRSSPWSIDLWEPKFKALVALIRSGTETTGMEQTLIKVLKAWIEGAFMGLTTEENPPNTEERGERQRSIENMTALLLLLVERTEFVCRITEMDTGAILELFGNLIDWALVSAPENNVPPASPFSDATIVSPSSSTTRIQLRHHRHHSSISVPQTPTLKSASDIAAESYLRYLDIRLRAIAPVHLKTILPQLFRALAFYASPLPRLSLATDTPHQHAIEKDILEKLDLLVTGPYSASCTVILKYHLFPEKDDFQTSMRTSLGALRTLRASIRRVLVTRLARAYISRTSSISYTPSGAPGQVDIPDELMERAWAKEDLSTWDLNRFRNVLCSCIKAWLEYNIAAGGTTNNTTSQFCEVILNEIAGILKDITQAFDEIGDELDYEEVEAVGDVLRELAAFVRIQRYPDGGIIRITLSQPEISTNFLTTLSTLLSQVFVESPLHPVLPSVILSLALHIPDTDTSQLIDVMNERESFSPTSPTWLENWQDVLSVPDLYMSQRSITRSNVMNTLYSVWEFVKDIPMYRRPLANLVFSFWRDRSADTKDDNTAIIIWRMLGDEVVLRSVESQDESPDSDEADNLAEDIIAFLTAVAAEPQGEDTENIQPYITPSVHPGSSTVVSPIQYRMQSEYPSYASPTKDKDREVGIPSVMSLLSSLTSGHSSRSQSQPPHPYGAAHASEPPQATRPEQPAAPRSVGAAVALVGAFSQLAFTSLAVVDSHLSLASQLFTTLISLLGGTACSKTKLTILQFYMRLRVDRDHRLYFSGDDYDRDGLVSALATLIGRGEKEKSNSAIDERLVDELEIRRARPKLPQQERIGRRPSRGRGGQPSGSGSSRSRSRAASRMLPHPAAVLKKLKPKEPLWTLPETLPFVISAEADTPSERLASYDPDGPANRVVLPLSSFLGQAVNIIKTSKDWDLLSYVLCHLPSQLANKHLFCGPRSRVILTDLLVTLCNSILDGTLASTVERWPDGIIPRDAQGLAYQTLAVLISYKRCFKEIHLRHKLVEVFLVGLSGQPSTIRCCLNALSLSAFELQPSMTKYLPRILEKLSQIMSNPANAVHIIDFLAIVGSLPTLHSNFTEQDYKMVFGVALQYLQQHNRPDSSVTISWALSQHVCVMSYYIVYLWFLAVKLLDRPRHIKYITRQLLLANDGRDEVDESTEVCFDWLARYTYASADPRPATSMLSEMIMSSVPQDSSAEPAISEKTWIMGNSVVTIRALVKRGWVEIVSRRASGLSKFLCRAENVPMITPGDVDPDILSFSATLVMDRDVESADDITAVQKQLADTASSTTEAARPDSITGYVWSRSAPSQRRKEVAIDPSYFALQLSSYPDNKPSTHGRIVIDSSKLPAFFRSLDRMPVIDTHKVGILYVAPGQSDEREILENTHGSPAYARFLEGIGRLIDLRGQVDVYAGGLDPDEDGEYAYAWWDEIGQILYHTATLMPPGEESYTNKKRHIGNDYVRIVWNDSGYPYRFDTLSTQFQFVNIVIEPHSRGAIAAFSNNLHENEYFKVTLQRAPGMPEFTPIGEFKLISAERLPLLVRQLSLLTDWFVDVYQDTKNDTARVEKVTNWRHRLRAIKRFRTQQAVATVPENLEGVLGQEVFRDFTTAF